jgi:hypothetical protein
MNQDDFCVCTTANEKLTTFDRDCGLHEISIMRNAVKRYQNLNGNSGVVAYEIADDAIKVQFSDGITYLYTYDSSGRQAIEKMKALAQAGRGLSTFISQHVREAYAAKL